MNQKKKIGKMMQVLIASYHFTKIVCLLVRKILRLCPSFSSTTSLITFRSHQEYKILFLDDKNHELIRTAKSGRSLNPVVTVFKKPVDCEISIQSSELALVILVQAHPFLTILRPIEQCPLGT